MAKKKTTLYLDDELLASAQEASGVNVTETVRKGLEALVRSAAYQQTLALLGSEKGRSIYDVPRRRESPAKPKPRVRQSV